MGCCGRLMMRVGPLVLSLDGKLLGQRRMTKKINVHPEWLILQNLTNGTKRKLDHLLLHLFRVDIVDPKFSSTQNSIIVVVQLPNNHHQPSSPATSNHHLHGFTTLHLPQTPSSSSSPSTITTETSTTLESLMAAAIGHAISNIKSTSFQDALTTTTTNTTTTNDQLARQLSDATSFVTQYLSTTTPPKIPMQNVLRHANTDMIINECQEQPHARTRSHKRIRRAISDAVEYHHQQPP
ncbi:hypothetical protein Tco_1528051 [Tanacetum coccineum]